jgi:6-phosphogluconolactonase (cycloisomerase 2 family)
MQLERRDMSEKIFAYVGNWSFQPNPQKGKGISVFQFFPENGDLKLLETVRPDVAAGQLHLDGKRKILYAVDERGERRGEIGGGGYVMAFRIDPVTGKLTFIAERESLAPEPSYLCLDKSGKYLVACHCSDPFHVTKIVRRPDGTYGNEVHFDDTALVMFRIGEDGSLGDICDVAITEGTGGKSPRAKVNVDPVSGHIQLVQVLSRQHSVVASPSGEMLAVCDKGMDRIYTYRIDRANGKLIHLDTWIAEEVACFPRYAAFHPVLPVYYANNENYAGMNSFHYDEQSGKLTLLKKLFLLPQDPGLVEGKPVGAQDILVHPNGKVLYITLCGLNLIVVCELDAAGLPTEKQLIDSNGRMPRGLALSPDQRFLLSGNMLSGDITTFAVNDDGTLTSTGRTWDAVSPSAIRFFTAQL